MLVSVSGWVNPKVVCVYNSVFQTGVPQNLRVPPNLIEKWEVNEFAASRRIFWAVSSSFKIHLR